MKKVLRLILCITVISFGITGCELQTGSPADQTGTNLNVSDDAILKSTTASGLSETFESGTKTAYTAAAVTLSSGSWYFTDAVIGTSSYDSKNGSQSARIRNTGKITMQFDLTGGAGTVTIAHSVYNADASTTWELYQSADAGSTWTKVGSTITSSSSTLATQSFTVNQTGTIRFEIRKTAGTGRMNIDDVAVTSYTSTSTDTSTSTTTTTTTTLSDNDNALMGNPSGAVTSTSYPNNYLMIKTQYTLGYSDEKKTPIWTSWHLQSSDLSGVSRVDSFAADTTLPSGWYQVKSSDYTSSGFSRGHMCCCADRLSTTANMKATFLMTNMIPQCQTNNGGAWEGLETYERTLVTSGSYEAYIICGPAGKGGYTTTGSTPSNTYKETIGSTSYPITVPKSTWKIIVLLPAGNSDLSRVTSSTRVIAVNMPNDNTCGGSSTWGNYRVSVRALETLTGFNFLSNLSSTVQDAIETAVDTGATE